MARKVRCLLLAFLFLVPRLVFAFGVGGPSSTATAGLDSPWWYDGSLSFWAPFDDPSNPLKLNVGTGPISLTRATTATYEHPTTGFVTTAFAGQLRIEAAGALFEGARTNVALHSETFDDAVWLKYALPGDITVTPDYSVAPDNTTTADRVAMIHGTGGITMLYQVFTGTNERYTLSVWAKTASGTQTFRLRAYNGSGAATFENSPDLTATTSWQRFTFTTTNPIPAVADAQVAIANNAADEAATIEVWGFQAEAGVFASSYIPTTTATATRNADQPSVPAANYSVSAGSCYAEADTADPTWNGRIIVSTMPNSNMMVWFDQAGFVSINDGTNNPVSSAYAPNTNYKMASSWGGDGLKVTVNAAVPATSAYDGTFGGGVIGIGNTGGFSGYELFGHIKNLRIWNRSLTAAELQSLTQ